MMMKIATFIVNKRKAFLVFFGLAAVFCVMSISKVNVNDDLTEYLPDTTETRMGLDIMEEEFTTFGSARILVANVTYDKAKELAEHMEEIKGISSVGFYDPEDEAYDDDRLEEYYKDCSALFTLAFEEEEDTELSQKAIAEVREYLADYDTYVYTTVDKDDSASLQEDMKVILVIAVLIIIAVLFFTSTTYMEIVIFMLTFGMAAILSKGTNFLFGTVSFISNAVDIVLQLALAIDYAIILFHRFMEEKEHLHTKQALIVALSKAIPEISSSSLTTMAGMIALMLMQFGIGRDLGSVLTKAIILSMVSVFCFMPALIMMFSKAIDRTRHKSFVPKISIWGKIVVKTRYILLPVFLAVVVAGCIFSNRCHYIYDVNSVVSEKQNEYIASKNRINETFDTTNVMAIVVPKGDYEREAAIVADLENVEEVDTITALSNVEVGDNGEYVLTDELNPREFAEVADTDIDLVRFVYRAYALDKEEYGALLSSIDEYDISILSMIDFIYEQKQTRALSLDEDVSEDIDEMYDAICDAREQLEGENYSRIVVQLTGPVEGEETFAVVDRIRDLALKQYDEVYVVGDPTSNYDLSKSFSKDNVLISVLTALFVGIILLFTFQNAALPFMLVLTIQGSIWINFSLPYLKNETMFFISYLVVSSIQMGATIDYAIVITTRYMDLRQQIASRKEAVVEALNQAFPTIITSGTIMCSAGFVIGKITSNAVIASLGTTLGWGTLISIILVMLILPQILLVGDKITEKAAFSVNKSENEEDEADEE
ncbi:MAG: MMPL family transporter [Lachnospiraceae bacterium]|nr:MMPL family transporter [Lachnospiraceae bacterium]